MTEDQKKKLRKARRRHLTERLENLRVRTELIETELQQYTDDFFRVCIFGSARIKPHDEIYELTHRTAYLLGAAGIDVLTGGGPGLMEAGNKGAKEGRDHSGSKSRSFGISIEINTEKLPNEHLDVKHHHRKFSSRLDDFMRLSHGIIVMPGGIGTILELYFSWQLIQVKHIDPRPLVLVGTKFWSGLVEWMKTTILEKNLVSSGDFECLHIVDTPEAAVEIVKRDFERFSAKKAAAADSGNKQID
jgi:hypothetical protein